MIYLILPLKMESVDLELRSCTVGSETDAVQEPL